MKCFSVFFIIFIFFINSNLVQAEDSLTTKQQLDRIMEEIKDLNKAVFNKSFNSNEVDSNEKQNDTERFTSIDIRIYDLEKDIKNLTLQFEEIIFKLDDLSNEIKILESNFSYNFEKNSNEINENLTIKEENTLGKLIISDSKSISSNVNSETLDEENNNSQILESIENLNPEDQLQFALDQLMKKNYDKSKEILENFIISFPENQLSGSAHFWLGKIYLFELNYREAAIIFGEGVQKFPKSIKSAEMYYELSKSLKEMGKNSEACNTLEILNKNYKGNKFTKDPEKIKENLNCESQN